MKQAVSADPRFVACPNCGTSVSSRREETDSFTYGVGDEAVTLSVSVPVYTCDVCATQFTDEEAEDRRHDAVCRHLGVLTPSEIRDTRTRNGLSRSEFARLTRIGDATVARWERGSLIQNAGYDQLLRLLQYSDNLQRLRAISGETDTASVTQIATFRHLTRTPELDAARSAFQLQKAKR